MRPVEVFSPAWCHTSFGPHDGVSDACRFAADVDWLAAQGVAVRRSTLTEAPARFVEHDAIRLLMNVFGPRVLPVVLVDGVMRWHGTYPTREQLAAWSEVDLAEADVVPLSSVARVAERREPPPLIDLRAG